VLSYLKASGADVRGVQMDPELPTRRTLSAEPEDGIATCAFEALDWNLVADLLLETSPSLIFQSLASLRSEAARSVVSRLQATAGVPCFLDIDLDDPGIRERDVRRLLLGSKWIRISAEHLSELARPAGESRRSRLWGEARAVRQAFALAAVVVERHGMPLVIVSADHIARGKRPRGPARPVPADARDAATAALIRSVLGGASAPAMLRRALADMVQAAAERGFMPEIADPEARRVNDVPL
jgi:sugar/nucleoside kinase (ribokinase family)